MHNSADTTAQQAAQQAARQNDTETQRKRNERERIAGESSEAQVQHNANAADSGSSSKVNGTKVEVAATRDQLAIDEQQLLKDSTEEELLARAAELDEAALGELYDRYELKIYNYIYRRTSDPTLSEDLTAQVFLKMLEAIHNSKAWHSSFSGWLYRIAHNLVIDHYRVRDRQKSVSLEDTANMVDPDDNPVHAAEVRLDAEYLQAAIRRLTDEQAQVISLRFLEGYSFGEIAAMMDKTEGAVKALQHRAVATLRQIMVYD